MTAVRYLIDFVPPPPTSDDLAQLIALVSDEGEPHLLDSLIALFRRPDEANEMLTQLVATAEDAGIAEEGPSAVLSGIYLKRQLCRLAQTPGWQRAEDVLDPNGERGVDHQALLCLARSQCRSVPGGRGSSPFEAVSLRLEAGVREGVGAGGDESKELRNC